MFAREEEGKESWFGRRKNCPAVHEDTGVPQAGDGQMVQMDSSKSGFVGSQVELRCIFINSNPPVKISQVTWQKFLNGTKQNVAIANPALGVSVLPPFKERVTFKQAAVRHRTPSLEDTTIVFSSLQLSDEAAYICEYTTFPAGNRENMVNLTVFARPTTRMTLTTPTIVARSTKRKMTVATCISANGKPPSVIKWDTRLKGEATFQETRNQNGTVTVRSNYVVVPSRETHKQKLTCIVTYRSERITESVVLNVQYEPEVTIEGFDANWYLNRPNVQLTCKAEANPPVTIYQWKLLNGSLPSNVEIKNNTLFFKGPVTYDLAGTYVCDATNGIGTRTGIVDVNITVLALAELNDPVVELKKYADASLTSKSIFVPPYSLRQAWLNVAGKKEVKEKKEEREAIYGEREELDGKGLFLANTSLIHIQFRTLPRDG
ncbi:Nectin-1 [Dissostichus eleginoides]|nr:Nectin-1 [Dissostichus eleginoides]